MGELYRYLLDACSVVPEGFGSCNPSLTSLNLIGPKKTETETGRGNRGSLVSLEVKGY